MPTVRGDEGVIVGEIWRVESRKGLASATELIESIPRDSIIVIEGAGYKSKGRYDSDWGLGRRAGIWEAIALVRGFVVHHVHPDHWQRGRLYGGRRNPGREQLKRLSVMRAVKELGGDIEVGPNAADAYNIYEWVKAELELGNVPWKR